MSTEYFQENSKPKRSFGSKVRIFLWTLMGLAVLVFALYFTFIYYYTFSDGWRSGTLTKFSRKGLVFKTWEGELYQRGAEDLSVNVINKQWVFSVEKDKDKVIENLETYIGDEFRVHYQQRAGKLFWLGETNYFVDSVVLVKRRGN